MKKIASFTVNHLDLKRGVYVSRRDVTPSGDVITTFDVRMKEPNRESPLAGDAIHTIEHLAATFLRNHPEWSSRIVYWGPMGCLTGNYLIVSGDYDSSAVVALLRETFRFIADFEGDIPGATARDCGNYTYNDLNAAKAEALKFLTEILDDPLPDNLNYPA